MSGLRQPVGQVAAAENALTGALFESTDLSPDSLAQEVRALTSRNLVIVDPGGRTLTPGTGQCSRSFAVPQGRLGHIRRRDVHPAGERPRRGRVGLNPGRLSR